MPAFRGSRFSSSVAISASRASAMLSKFSDPIGPVAGLAVADRCGFFEVQAAPVSLVVVYRGNHFRPIRQIRKSGRPTTKDIWSHRR